MAGDDSGAGNIPVILEQLKNLGGAVERIERSIARDITALKTEQIAELRKAVDRLADDQRRLWDAVRVIENRQNENAGGMRVLHGAIAAVGGLVGSIITLVGSLLMRH